MNFSFYYDILNKFKTQFLLLIISSIGCALVNIGRGKALKGVLDYLHNCQEASFSSLPILLYLASWGGIEFFYNLIEWVKMYLTPIMQQHVIAVFTKRMNQYPNAFFKQNKSATLTSALKNIYDELDDVIYIILDYISNLCFIAGVFFAMYSVHKQFTLIVVMWFIVLFIIGIVFFRYIYLMSYKINDSKLHMITHLSDMFDNTLVVRVYNATSHEEKLTNSHVRSFVLLAIKRGKVFFSLYIFQGLSFLGILFTMFYILLPDYNASKITIGDITMMMDYVYSTYFRFFELFSDFFDFSESAGKIKRSNDLIWKEFKSYHHSEKFGLLDDDFDIAFDNISYSYPNTSEHAVALDGKIEIPFGQTVALIGESGSGKSTFVQLLLGIMRPDSGKILLGNKDINTFDMQSVRKNFAFIPQDVGLFYRSFKDNIMYGSFDATFDEVVNAAKKAEIHDFIMSLPLGYETFYGGNVELSGGQKQRILIARGLLRKAKIFIFDEPTSALDVCTEVDILKNIHQSTAGFTKFIIAHRLYTIKNADLILVFQKGKIIELGNHQELVQKNGIYNKMINLM